MLNRFVFFPLFVTCFLLACCGNTAGQGIAVNIDQSAADSSAILDIKSTDKGLLPPRLTRQQIFAIRNPAAGLMIYNNTANKPVYYDGTNWRFFNDSIFTMLVNGVNADEAAAALNAKRIAGFGTFPAVSAVKWNDTLSNAAFKFAKDIAAEGDGINFYTTASGGFIMDYPALFQYNRPVYFSLVYVYPATANVATIINEAFNTSDNFMIGGFMEADAREFGMGYYNNRWYLIMTK